ncbi:MAG: hypothetical protein FJ191_01925 [Gammaproteobacteria bacterium]|nr:hypothetical protein [Gammaproteobacteria bacterium]
MDLSKLELLLREASERTGHKEFVIAGSLAVLGVLGQRPVPDRMLVSIDVDCWTPADPGRVFDLNDSLGAGSPFERAHGYYLDPISPQLPTLPAGWDRRVIRVPMRAGIAAWFLDPNDTAVSKYARGEPRDREWIRAGLQAGLLSGAIIEGRFRATNFLNAAEASRARRLLAADLARVG